MFFALLLAATVTSATPWCFGECGECKESKICKDHKDADAAALKELKPRLRSKEEEERLAALKELGLLNLEHENAPSKSVTGAIASALKDKSHKVKTEAARLLQKHEHPEASVNALIAALEEIGAEFAKSGRQRERGGGSSEGNAEQRREMEDFIKFATNVVDGLSQLPDDRSVKALTTFLNQLPRQVARRLAMPVSRSLSRLSSRDAVKALIQRMSQLETAGRKGRREGGTERNTAAAKELHSLMLRLALMKDLEDMPDWGETASSEWQEWFTKNQKHFPSKLGKISLEKRRQAQES